MPAVSKYAELATAEDACSEHKVIVNKFMNYHRAVSTCRHHAGEGKSKTENREQDKAK
jgi:hypothetical protein